MDEKEQSRIFFDTLAKVLIRWFFISMAFLIFWFLIFLAGADRLYTLNSRWFDISQRDFILVNYYGMAFIKISAYVFLLFPYLAIRLVLRKK